MITRDGSSDFIDIELGETKPLVQPEVLVGLVDIFPNEVLLGIIANLPLKNLIALSRTCHRLHTLVNVHLLTCQRPEFHIYRIGLFKHQQALLNDDIEEANAAKFNLQPILYSLVVGGSLTGLSASVLKNTFNSSHNASRDEKILVVIFFIATLAILLSSIGRVLYNLKIHFDINSYSEKIDELENNINHESFALRHPDAPKLLK